jgi:hypothetical protein
MMNQQYDQAKLMEEAEEWRREREMNNIYDKNNISK